MSRRQDEHCINLEQDEWEQMSSDTDERKRLISQTRGMLDLCQSILTDQQIFVVEHTFWLGETQCAIAKQMGISQQAVACYLKAAKKKIGTHLTHRL